MRIFERDVLTCPNCQGKLKAQGVVMQTKEINRYLEKVGIPHLPQEKASIHFTSRIRLRIIRPLASKTAAHLLPHHPYG